MNEKRNIPVGFKLTETEKKEADEISEKYGKKPGSLAGLLLREFIKAHKKYNERIKFPPEFDYYEEHSRIRKMQIETEAQNKSLKEKAS